MKHKICLFILLAAIIFVNAEESAAEQAPIDTSHTVFINIESLSSNLMPGFLKPVPSSEFD